MADLKRKAHAKWSGDLQQGKGTMSTESGVVDEAGYSFHTRFENEPGTNPEELIAAAHAGCYSMALANELAEAGYTPERVETDATCTLASEDGGFSIAKMRLVTEVQVPNIDEAKFQEIVDTADQHCPVSNLLREGLEIEIDAKLA